MARKLYVNKTVDVALAERMAWIFDTYGKVVVSVSGGKDSTVLLDAARKEALRRGTTVFAFFLDQEAEYGATVEHVRHLMALPGVMPVWMQVPLRMTNATSYEEAWLHAWEPGAEWMRPKEAHSIHDLPGAPDRFHAFFEWWEARFDADTAFLVGLRAEEALNRYRAVTKNPAVPGINWSSRTKGPAVKLYPLYDFTFEDIWTYLGKNGVPYNRAYDWMWAKGHWIQELRVSNLIHEQAFHSLSTLQEFEHDTFEALQRRLKGVHAAALYAGEQSVYQTLKRPKAYPTWTAYRDFLLQTLPIDVGKFRTRFARQPEAENVARSQCRALLLNDHEGNLPIDTTVKDPRASLAKWMEIL
ncbi:phosphoadenosine phosphosulfate reductase family protein [Methylobacterium sp. BTF04]|uniref:phosphoadenosine phosphosulfate reductase domain-containing protein n=1 Tax=Methylobacterium sp. BTF04 TaxID=2708300 RepID=UPI0013D2AD4C|nr:phosphoadenosine phosphosulfate reductase family protein [Methylobacterium sp. BTF04]NEU13501.1 phosphoadenosine phosphosulfate reductase family protein [Methylobacterium sp. BTF04]